MKPLSMQLSRSRAENGKPMKTVRISLEWPRGMVMNRLANVVTYGLPSDFYSTYRERLAAVTPTDIGRVGKSLLTPSAVTVVAVGDLKTIEAPIKALNLGTVEVWSVDGQRIR